MPTVGTSLPGLFFTDEMPRPYPTIFGYGIAGSGKTNALRTLQHLNPIVLATEDGQTKGMGTLADLKLAALLLDTLDHLIHATAELAAHAQPGKVFYQGKGPFGCAILDSCTGVGPMLENAALAMKGWKMIWDTTDTPGGRGHDPRSAYPYINERGRQVVRKLMDLPVPLILTCREQLLTEGEGANAKTYPAPELPGQKLPRELPGWPEATVRFRMLNGQRVLQTENEGDVVARVRLREGWRLKKFCKPDLGALVRLLQGDQTALSDLELPSPEVKKTPQQLAAEAARAAQTTR